MRSGRWASATSWPRNCPTWRSSSCARCWTTARRPIRRRRRCSTAIPTWPAIYNIGAGNAGIARALKERGRQHQVVFIGHEATEGTKALLLDGTLDAVIDQNPRVEAREALNLLTAAVRGMAIDPHPPRLQVVFKENIPEI